VGHTLLGTLLLRPRMWTAAARAGVEFPSQGTRSGPLGISPQGAPATEGSGERSESEKPVGYADQHVSERSGETGAQRRVRRTVLSGLLMPFSFIAVTSTVPRLERQRKPGTSGETIRTPLTRTPPPHPRSGRT